MNEQPIWKYIDEYDKLPGTTFVHCDTRDFNIMCVDRKMQVTDMDEIIKDALTKPDIEDCMFRRAEILGALKTIECATGGKGVWRCIQLKHRTDIGWLKYIRFVMVKEGDEPIYLCYTTRGPSKYILISRTDLDPDNIDMDEAILNFMESE